MPLGIGYLALAILIGVVGIWSVQAKIAGAVLGPGRIEVASSKQLIQHSIGGIVSKIVANNGDYVAAGDVVLKLDDTSLQSELAIIEGELLEILAQEARLKAEIEGSKELVLHSLLAKAAENNTDINNMLDGQRQRFEARSFSVAQETSLLEKQIQQVVNQIAGMRAQLRAKIVQKETVDKELDSAKKHFESGLIVNTKLYTLEKEQALVLGEAGNLRSKIAELKSVITGLELKILDLPAKRKEEAVVELSKLQPDKIKLLEKRSITLDSLSNLEIRTPINGVVHDSKVLGIRSVITPATPLMYIVPKDQPTIVIVQIEATDIDQVFVGQSASLRFKAFNRRNTPVIIGRVEKLSADAYIDTTKRRSYYEAEISLASSELEKLDGQSLIPGMPVDAYISTKERSPLNYLVKPLADYFNRAFRDA